MQRRRCEPCQNSVCCDVTAQSPCPGWSSVTVTSWSSLDIWTQSHRAACSESICGTTSCQPHCPQGSMDSSSMDFHPNSSIPAFWSAAIDVLDARLREDTAGYPRAKQLPFLAVSFMFLLSALKSLSQAGFC